MSETHVRRISATLSLLDKGICEFDEWTKVKEIRSALYEVRNTLTFTQQQGILRETAKTRTILDEIRTPLRLERSVRHVDKMILSSCSVLWASLAELEGRQLRRYGELPPGLAEYIDPKAKELNERLRSMVSSIHAPRVLPQSGK